VSRTVLRRLAARDEEHSTAVAVEPGTVLNSCRVVRNAFPCEAADVYIVQFELSGRTLQCPLVDFQARTHAIQPLLVEEIPAREKVAIS
jgi:hypothetical protein